MQPKKRLFRNDVSDQTRLKQSVSHKGKLHSKDTKAKISKALREYWAKLPTKPINNNDTSTTYIYGKEN